MKTMTLEEIKATTLSTHMTTPNCVYKVNEACDGVNYRDSFIHEFNGGELVCVSGCGELHKSGQTAVYVGKNWCNVPNQCLDHYANDILQRVQ